MNNTKALENIQNISDIKHQEKLFEKKDQNFYEYENNLEEIIKTDENNLSKFRNMKLENKKLINDFFTYAINYLNLPLIIEFQDRYNFTVINYIAENDMKSDIFLKIIYIIHNFLITSESVDQYLNLYTDYPESQHRINKFFHRI